eukprot:4351364-Pyramimonas_sp.AAC.1
MGLPAQGEDGCRTGDITVDTRLSLAFGGEKRLKSLAQAHDVCPGNWQWGGPKPLILGLFDDRGSM